MNKLNLVSAWSEWLVADTNGFFITLNTPVIDHILFESHLRSIAHKLNDYCYGRSYKRKEKCLKIIAGIENGKINDGLHSHIIVTHIGDIKRTLQEVNAFIRKHWYRMINRVGIFGSMVDVQKLGDINTRFTYVTKDTGYLMRSGNFNIVAL